MGVKRRGLASDLDRALGGDDSKLAADKAGSEDMGIEGERLHAFGEGGGRLDHPRSCLRLRRRGSPFSARLP